MRLLLTGGTGFIGRATIYEAQSRGATVAVLSRRFTLDRAPGVEALALGGAPWEESTIADALAEFRPNAIIHLAGGPVHNTPEELYESNVFLGRRLLAAAQIAVPAAHIILAGSAAEYGPPLTHDGATHETDIPRPVSFYGVAKLAQTLNGMIAARGGQSVTAARIFNPVGPGMPLGLAFADFAHQIASGSGQLTTGDIDAERDFMPVCETARILMDLLYQKAGLGLVVNICSGQPQPVRRGVEHLLACAGRPIVLVENAAHRTSDVRTIFGDTTALKSIGINPASPEIEGALKELFDYTLQSVHRS